MRNHKALRRPGSIRHRYNCFAVKPVPSSPSCFRKVARAEYLGDREAVSKYWFSLSSLSSSLATALTVSVSQNRSFRYSFLAPSRECVLRTARQSFRAMMQVSSGTALSCTHLSITRTISRRVSCSSSPSSACPRFLQKRVSAGNCPFASSPFSATAVSLRRRRLVSDSALWWAEVRATLPPLKLQASSSSQEMRLKWSLTSMRRRSSSSCGEMGLMSLLICRSWCSRTLMRRAMELSWKGQNPNAISYITTPRLQMSAFTVQISPRSTSGAMQIGEPSIVCARSRWLSRLLQKPKSPSFTAPLCSMMFDGFRSRCMMLLAFRMRKASTSCSRKPSTLCSGRKPWRRISWSRVPALQNSQKKQKLLTVLRISMKRTMWGESMRVSTSISLSVHSSSLGFQRKRRTFTTFAATSRPERPSTPRQTLPYSPSPICSCSVQFSIIFTIRQFQMPGDHIMGRGGRLHCMITLTVAN